MEQKSILRIIKKYLVPVTLQPIYNKNFLKFGQR